MTPIGRTPLQAGGDPVHIYDVPLQLLAALLAVGFLSTLFVRPLRASTHAA